MYSRRPRGLRDHMRSLRSKALGVAGLRERSLQAVSSLLLVCSCPTATNCHPTTQSAALLPFSLAPLPPCPSSQIVEEVRERINFLESMKALGKAGQYEAQVGAGAEDCWWARGCTDRGMRGQW